MSNLHDLNRKKSAEQIRNEHNKRVMAQSKAVNSSDNFSYKGFALSIAAMCLAMLIVNLIMRLF